MVIVSKEIVEKTKKLAVYGGKKINVYQLNLLSEIDLNIDKLPFSIRILLENALRNFDDFLVTTEDINTIANWPANTGKLAIPYMPSRAILQDFTGVPLIVDLAAMRDAMKKHGGDAQKINPLIPTDIVIDHSVQVDSYGSKESLAINLDLEYQRNSERYNLIKWAQKAFKNFRVVPPGSGIVHQVNLEHLAKVVDIREFRGEPTAVVDTVIGTDSHTTMINGLGVMGWGAGGIEAEAVMLGQPYYMLLPEVIGFKLTGQLPEGTTATDLVLTVVKMLRKKGVVGKFVEFFGPGLFSLSLPDRATIANMAPEYGATMGFFPVDDVTLEYMRLTGRSEDHISFVREYLINQNLFLNKDSPFPTFSDTLELDMSEVKPSIAGPHNPDELVSLEEALERVIEYQENHISQRSKGAEIRTSTIELEGETVKLTDGNIVIAAITSCTNTSNPFVLIGAGLLAKRAVELGLKIKPYVKTSFAPGSLVVTDYMRKLGLDKYLEELGFHTVGYGCTSCIGNSGPLKEQIEEAIKSEDLYVTSVISGNRNFPGRVHQLTLGNFLASPILVVAYALAGKTDINLLEDVIAEGKDGNPIYLKDLWPTQEEINEAVERGVNPDMFTYQYSRIFDGDIKWQALDAPKTILFDWREDSTYARHPPFFERFTKDPHELKDIVDARVLMLLDDKVSTDHISPAGAIAKESPAAKYLLDNNVKESDFNTYGSRRGNHEVMMRGTFANIRVKNQIVPGKDGWWSKFIPDDEVMSIFDASRKYLEHNISVIGIGSEQYGQGSSRDWAAKGPALLGMKAVLVKSIERIHRSNLIGMGILPLQFEEGQGWRELGLNGTELYSITGIAEGLTPLKKLEVCAKRSDSTEVNFKVITRIDTAVEIEYYRYGGILNYVLAQLLKNS